MGEDLEPEASVDLASELPLQAPAPHRYFRGTFSREHL